MQIIKIKSIIHEPEKDNSAKATCMGTRMYGSPAVWNMERGCIPQKRFLFHVKHSWFYRILWSDSPPSQGPSNEHVLEPVGMVLESIQRFKR
jgi:hypothetical protein